MGDLERARGHIEEGRSALVLFERKPGQIIVLLLGKHLITESDSRGDKFRDTPFHEFFSGHKFRVLQLITYRNLVTRSDKLREVHINGMMGEARHRKVSLVSVGALCQNNAQDLARKDRVIRICFIEIADPVKEDRLRIQSFCREELLYEWSILRCCCFRHISFNLAICRPFICHKASFQS